MKIHGHLIAMLFCMNKDAFLLHLLDRLAACMSFFRGARHVGSLLRCAMYYSNGLVVLIHLNRVDCVAILDDSHLSNADIKLVSLHATYFNL